MKRKVWLFGGLILLGMAIAIALMKIRADWFNPNYLDDLSSILTLISFSVRSMLTLRILAIGAQLTFIPYCFFQPTILWTPVVWTALFLVVNVFNVIVLLLERRPVALNPDEQRLYDLAFKSLSPREFLQLTSVGEWRDGQAGDKIITQGQTTTDITLLSRGEAVSFHDESQVAKIPEDKLLGIPEAMEGDRSVVDIRLTTPSRYLRWSYPSLLKFTDKRPQLREKLRLVFIHDLVKTIRKLEEIELESGHKIEQAVQSI